MTAKRLTVTAKRPARSKPGGVGNRGEQQRGQQPGALQTWRDRAVWDLRRPGVGNQRAVAQQSLLELQQRYGNRHARRALAGGRGLVQRQKGGASAAEQESKIPELDLRFVDRHRRRVFDVRIIIPPRDLPGLGELYKRRNAIKRHIPAVVFAALASVSDRREMQYLRSRSLKSGVELVELPESYLRKPPTYEVLLLVTLYHAIDMIEAMVREKERRIDEAQPRIAEIGGVGTIGTRKQLERARMQRYVQKMLSGLTGSFGGVIGFGIASLLTDDPEKIAAATTFGEAAFGLISPRGRRRGSSRGGRRTTPRRTPRTRQRRLKTRARRARTARQKARTRRRQRTEKAKAKARQQQSRARKRPPSAKRPEAGSTPGPGGVLETWSITLGHKRLAREHKLHLVRRNGRLSLWLCSTKCGELLQKVEIYLRHLPREHKLHKKLDNLRTELAKLAAREEQGETRGLNKGYELRSRQFANLAKQFPEDMRKLAEEEVAKLRAPEEAAPGPSTDAEPRVAERPRLRKRTRGQAPTARPLAELELPRAVQKSLDRVQEIKAEIERLENKKKLSKVEGQKLSDLRRDLAVKTAVHELGEFKRARDETTQILPRGTYAALEERIWLEYAQKLINDLNRKGAKQGDGSAAFAIIGEQVRGGAEPKKIIETDRLHYDKAWEYSGKLRSLLSANKEQLRPQAKNRLRLELKKIEEARRWADRYEEAIESGTATPESLLRNLPGWVDEESRADLERYQKEWRKEQGGKR